MSSIVSIFEFSFKDKYLNLEYKINRDKKGLEVAYYIYRNNKREKVIWYEKCSKNNTLKYEVNQSGIYHIKIFVRSKGNIEFVSTEKINVNINSKVATQICRSEKIFNLDDDVKYIFQPNKDSKKLIVIFSGISKAEYEGGKPLYNYVRKLEELKENKLFILDDYKGEMCYYIGRDGKHDFEKVVLALITSITNKLNIRANDVCVIGSSKGGTAALYYGIKYNYGSVYCGAPQTYVADYLNQVANIYPKMKEIFENILGSDKEKNYKWLNSFVFDLVKEKENFPQLKFHVGSGDKHYKMHLQPLLDILNEKGVNYELDIQEYSNHGETGTYFSKYLLKSFEK